MGYDEHSFGYRDLEGSKVHKALREECGEAYRQGDVIGCFIHMPAGGRRLEKSKASESLQLLLCHFGASCCPALPRSLAELYGSEKERDLAFQ